MQEDDPDYQAFHKVFELKPYGNAKMIWTQIINAAAKDNKEPSYYYTQYRNYFEMCRHEKREGKYIKTFENFMKEGMYNGVYNYETNLKAVVLKWLS